MCCCTWTNLHAIVLQVKVEPVKTERIEVAKASEVEWVIWAATQVMPNTFQVAHVAPVRQWGHLISNQRPDDQGVEWVQRLVTLNKFIQSNESLGDEQNWYQLNTLEAFLSNGNLWKLDFDATLCCSSWTWGHPLHQLPCAWQHKRWLWWGIYSVDQCWLFPVNGEEGAKWIIVDPVKILLTKIHFFIWQFPATCWGESWSAAGHVTDWIHLEFEKSVAANSIQNLLSAKAWSSRAVIASEVVISFLCGVCKSKRQVLCIFLNLCFQLD